MTTDTGLYGRKRPSDLRTGTELSSPAGLGFTSQLSALIASSTSNRGATKGRSSAAKDDIFRSHNRNVAKRAKRDLESDTHDALEQKHTTNGENVESQVLSRNRRKMQEKSRIYAAMQRGDLEDVDGRYAVDFDGKWAEEQEAQTHGAAGKAQTRHGRRKDDDDDDDDDDDSVEEERVSYIDEFGRTRTGSRLDARIATQQASSHLQEATTARPHAPSNVIYGDTIQHQAFDPSTTRAAAIASLASKRDASLTPPPEEHFDASKEIRTKGTGFFQFGESGAERERQMAGLQASREETERVRTGREDERQRKIQERKEALERRREEIMQRSAKRKAGEFLEELARTTASAPIAIAAPNNTTETDSSKRQDEARLKDAD